MAIRVYYVLVILGSFLVPYCQSYPDGAPTEACFNFRPAHGEDFSAQVDYKQYFTLTRQIIGGKGNPVKVTLRSVQSSRLFKGFAIRAVPGTFDPENWEDQPEPVGNWKAHKDMKLINCLRGESNAITHVDNDKKSQASFIWFPPKFTAGATSASKRFTFVATVVENYSRHYFGVASNVLQF